MYVVPLAVSTKVDTLDDAGNTIPGVFVFFIHVRDGSSDVAVAIAVDVEEVDVSGMETMVFERFGQDALTIGGARRDNSVSLSSGSPNSNESEGIDAEGCNSDGRN